MTCTECGQSRAYARTLCQRCYHRTRYLGTRHEYPLVRNRAAVVADVEFILATETADLPAVAARLGTTPGALERLLYRAERGDLVRAMRVRHVAMVRGGGV